MAGMSHKEIRTIVDYLVEQGTETTRTTKGILLRFPNRDTAMVHFTTSDVRARSALAAKVHRAGLRMPMDRREAMKLPDSITDAVPQRRTMERAQAALASMGNPHRVTTKQLINAGGALNPMGASRVLFALGWLPSNTERGTKRYWLAPEPEDVTADNVAPVVDLGLQPQPDTPAEPAAPEPREFLDTVDSWAAWEELPADMTVGDVRQLLAALHMHGELRVWRVAA